jgi:hypothetical protein
VRRCSKENKMAGKTYVLIFPGRGLFIRSIGRVFRFFRSISKKCTGVQILGIV